MALTSASDTTSNSGPVELGRVAIALAVVAAHVALIIMLGRGARHSAEVLEIMLFPLPITPEDRAQEPARVPELPSPREGEIGARHAARPRTASASAPPHAGPSQKPPRNETEVPENNVAESAVSRGEPAAPVDWYAEAHSSAEALEQRGRIERERRPLDGPKQRPPGPRHVKPACPFEKCEPNWGVDSIFKSQSTRKGRIEKTPDGEVIRWISNYCYQILVTADIMHRGMTRCAAPLDRKGPRGDLFKHMREVPPPEERATDVP